MHSAVFPWARQPAAELSVFSHLAGAPAAVVAYKRGLIFVGPNRNLFEWLSGISATGDHTSWVLRVARRVVCAFGLSVSVFIPIITNDPSPLVFLADPAGGALAVIAASLVISSSRLVTAGRPGGLWVSRVGGVGRARRVGVIGKSCRCGTNGRLWLPR